MENGDCLKDECNETKSLREKTDSAIEINPGQEDFPAKKGNLVIRYVLDPINNAAAHIYRKRAILLYTLIALLLVGFCVYFIAAMLHGWMQAIPLIVLTTTVLVIVLYELCFPRIWSSVKQSYSGNEMPQQQKVIIKRVWHFVLCFAVTAFFFWLLISIIIQNPWQLVSLVGLGLIIFICVIFSKYPNDINWTPVLWGIGMQFILGLLVLRTTTGFTVVKFIGDNVAYFMRYSDYGSSFVFGQAYEMHLFAFKVLPMIVYFSTVMNMLYYLGLMQWFIGKLAWLTQISLGTSAIESTVAVANIFVGMTEAPLVVRPYLSDLTKAEIHAVLTCGLGSIAFSVFGAFVEFKVDSMHLLTACVMSAPAGLAVSRLLYPERKQSKFLTTDSLALTEGKDRNIVEAAAAGASVSIGLVANIAANLIAFLALLAFINAALSWFGSFVGFSELSFELICGYLFMPLAFLMGADWEDCGLVGQLFGSKTFLNEFIAYKSMTPYIENRLSGDVPKYINGSVQYLSERSEVVAIHLLCGFCNVSSLGIIIGGLGSLMPTRKKDLAELAVRALMGGIFTCCMTASIASLLFIESSASVFDGNSTENINFNASTVSSWTATAIRLTTNVTKL